MLAVLILNFLALWASPTLGTSQSEHPAPATKTVKAPSDPYAPLRLYDGKWDLVQPSGVKACRARPH